MPSSFRPLLVFLVCVAIFGLGQFHRASGSVYAPILIDALTLPSSAVGLLVASMFLASIVALAPFGVALDRYGPRRILTLCLILSALGTALFALSSSYPGLLFARVLIGVSMASTAAAINIILARNFPSRQFGLMSGLVVSLGGIGGLLGTYPTSLALLHFSWLSVFLFVGLVTLLMAFLVFLALRGPAPSPPPSHPNDRKIGFLDLLNRSEIRRILALGVVTYAPITVITGIWGGPYYQDIHGLSPAASGGLLFLLFAAAIAGGFLFGFLDRFLPSRRLLILSASGVSLLCYLALALLPAPSIHVAAFLLTLMVLVQQFHIPLTAHLRRTVPHSVLGRASTLLSLVSVISIPVFQTGFGLILDCAAYVQLSPAQGYRIAFGAIALLITGSALIYSRVREADDD